MHRMTVFSLLSPVTVLAVFLTAMSASPASASDLQSLRLGPAVEQGGSCADHLAKSAAELLFFRYADLVTADAPVTLDVQVFVGGALFLSESLSVPHPDLEADPVVELLSRNPAEVALLFTAAAAEPGQIRLELTLNDGPTRSLTFEELVAHNQELLRGNLLPQVVVSAVDGLGGGETLQPASAAVVSCDQCWTNYDTCTYNNCGPELPPSICNRCDTELDICLANCEEPPPPPCEPWSEIVYVTDPVGYVSYGIDCFYDVYYPWQGHEFDEQLWTIKQTKIQRTHNCDGTITDTVLSVTYPQEFCYYRWVWDCTGFIRNRFGSCWY